MTAFFHHRSAVAAMLTLRARSAGTTCSPNVVDERPAAPGRRGGSRRRRSRASTSSASWSRCQDGIGRDEHRARRTSSGRTNVAATVEVLDQLEVPAQRRIEHVGAPLVVGDGHRLVVGRRPRHVHLEVRRLAVATVLAERVEHAPQGVQRLADGGQAVGPRADPRRGRLGDGGADQQRRVCGQGPQPGAVDGDQAIGG